MQAERTVRRRHLALVGQATSDVPGVPFPDTGRASFEQQERAAWAHIYHAAARAVGMLDRANPGIDDLIELADAARGAACLKSFQATAIGTES